MGAMPATLASGLDTPSDIAVDTSSIYWTEDDSPSRISRMSLGGGTPNVMASGLDSPTALSSVRTTFTGSTEPSVTS
jgi:hypothetical protein